MNCVLVTMVLLLFSFLLISVMLGNSTQTSVHFHTHANPCTHRCLTDAPSLFHSSSLLLSLMRALPPKRSFNLLSFSNPSVAHGLPRVLLSLLLCFCLCAHACDHLIYLITSFSHWLMYFFSPQMKLEGPPAWL